MLINTESGWQCRHSTISLDQFHGIFRFCFFFKWKCTRLSVIGTRWHVADSPYFHTQAEIITSLLCSDFETYIYVCPYSPVHSFRELKLKTPDYCHKTLQWNSFWSKQRDFYWYGKYLICKEKIIALITRLHENGPPEFDIRNETIATVCYT